MRPLLRSSLCVLVSFFILFSNSFCGIALAESSTESVYDFNNDLMLMSVVDDSTYSVKYYNGVYNRLTDSFDFGSSHTLFGGNYVTEYSNYEVYPAFKIEFTGTNMGSVGSVLSYFDDTIQFSIQNYYGLDDEIYYWLLGNAASPLICFADFEYSGTAQFGTAHTGGWIGTTTSSIPFPFSKSDTSEGKYYMQANLKFNLPEPTFFYYDYPYAEGTPDSFYNTKLTKFTIYIALNLNQNFTNSNGSWTPPDDASPFRVRTYRAVNNTLLSYDSSGVSNDSSNLIIGTIQNSISSMSSSVSSSISTLSSKLTESTNTITTKIDTMSQDIQTGLQNVVESAQQNAQNIINTVTQKVDEVKIGITEVKDSILDLPNKISEMLIGLVVPDEETINAKYAEFDELLSSRFGLIYQSADIIHDFADSFQTQAVMTADTGGIITLPSVTVNLAGTAFTFGGYDVDIIPDGFEQLQTAVRLAVSMVCTVVFVNMCKNKLEAILK